jgi:hypothetical protein
MPRLERLPFPSLTVPTILCRPTSPRRPGDAPSPKLRAKVFRKLLPECCDTMDFAFFPKLRCSLSSLALPPPAASPTIALLLHCRGLTVALPSSLYLPNHLYLFIFMSIDSFARDRALLALLSHSLSLSLSLSLLLHTRSLIISAGHCQSKDKSKFSRRLNANF